MALPPRTLTTTLPPHTGPYHGLADLDRHVPQAPQADHAQPGTRLVQAVVAEGAVDLRGAAHVRVRACVSEGVREGGRPRASM